AVRYHPAVVAQKAATVQLLSEGRFRLGLGSGENLNEHVVGPGWPAAHIRLEMLEEAVEIIRELFGGGSVNHHGRYFDVENARLWDLPDEPPPIGVAVSGDRSCELAGRLADLAIAIDPERELLDDVDRDTAVKRAHEQFRWSLGGWRVNAELPGPAAFEQASRYVRPEDVAESIPCGEDVNVFVDAVRPFVDAGFTEVALVQVGGAHQYPFLEWAEATLLPALRAMRPAGPSATLED
ncbi:5,10-methylene tetrahydromethanopterin reductase, partial [Streptomyces sp. NRRL S-444]